MKRPGRKSANASLIEGGTLRGWEKMMICQYPTANRHQNIIIGFGRKRRKRKEVAMTFIARAGIRSSVH
jgi:hypothetical protein